MRVKHIQWTLVFAMQWLCMVAVAQPTSSTVGKHAYYFDNGGKLKNPIRVYYYSPVANADTLPIVIMMHGASRDASAYLDGLIETADKLKCRIVAPEFDQEDFAGSEGYNLGNVYDRRKRKFNPPAKWTYSLIEPLFDWAVANTKSSAKAYYLYGHSAGSQFVHRFLMFVRQPRIIRVAMANAGWYTLPDNTIAFPYGLMNAPVDSAQLTRFFGLDACVLVGTADTDRDRIGFNVTEEGDSQGKNRFERGNYYFNFVKEKAAAYKVPFGWKLIHVPNVGHDNGKMGEAALPWLLGKSER